jgi:hypothetical protein
MRRCLAQLRKGLPTLVPVILLVTCVPASAAEPAWAPSVAYPQGARVTYGGIVFEAWVPHRSAPGWDPQNMPFLWYRPTPQGITEWADRTLYKVGSEVTFGLQPYRCLLEHYSTPDTTPDQAAYLWTGVCPDDGECVASKIVDSFVNLPRSAATVRITSDADVSETRQLMLVPRLSDGDGTGLQDLLELRVRQDFQNDSQVLEFFRNGESVGMTRSVGGEIDHDISDQPGSAETILAFTLSRDALGTLYGGVRDLRIGEGSPETLPSPPNSSLCELFKASAMVTGGAVGGRIGGGLGGAIGGGVGYLAGKFINCERDRNIAACMAEVDECRKTKSTKECFDQGARCCERAGATVKRVSSPGSESLSCTP